MEVQQHPFALYFRGSYPTPLQDLTNFAQTQLQINDETNEKCEIGKKKYIA